MAVKREIENKNEGVDAKTLNEYISFIEKIVGKSSNVIVRDPKNIKIERFPTGSYLLDQDLKGGWVKGTIIELSGDNQSGKTTTSIHAVAEHQKKYPNEHTLWVDLEKVFDPAYFQALGIDVDPSRFTLIRPSAGEDVWQTVIEFAKMFQSGIVVIDSVALLLPKKEEEGLVGDAQMASAARMNSQGLRKLFPHMKLGGTTIFALNQIRTNIGGYGDPNVTTGGKGWEFYARTRIRTSTSKGEAGEYAIHKFKQVKSNYGKRDVVTETTITYGEGFDITKEILMASIQKDIVQKSGSWFAYGDTKLGQGMDNVVILLEDNPELFQEISEKVKNVNITE